MADWQGDLSALEALGYMFHQQVECDVLFNVRGDVIGGHRSVVEARSVVLMKLVDEAASRSSPVSLDNIDMDTFKLVLEYLYTDEIDVTEENIFLLLHAASYFKMRHLEKRCMSFVGSFLHPHNLCTFANKAEEHGALDVCGRFVEVFSTNTLEVLNSCDFTELSLSVLAALLDTDQVSVLEIELFEAVIRWAAQECSRSHLEETGENMREVLKGALFKIRFPTMSLRDFSNRVTSIPGLLTDTEIARCFRKMTSYANDITCPFSANYRCYVRFSSRPGSIVGTSANLLSQSVCRHTNGQNQSVGNVLLWWNGSGHELPRSAAIGLIESCAELLNSADSGSTLEPNVDPMVRREILKAYNDFASYLLQHPANFKSSKTLNEALKTARDLIQILGSAN